ncbi:hypothetical protein C2S52_014605 [Perilla frutescens var. hirtella]|nr:hypothetical protein C2S52_014605 [Perilla frutescens var. hirtella]
MENEKRNEFELPPEIIEHIQSSMNGKEAARTTILSKSFYNSWRPNLDFDQRDFRNLTFSEITKKTLQRYEESKLKIESLTLRMTNDFDNPPLAKELIARAIKLGAVDLNISLWGRKKSFVLPDDVLRSETLVRLSVTGCRIDLGEVTCSKLKSLHLSRVLVKNSDLFRDLILKCPLIEKLVCGGRIVCFEYDHKLECEFHKLQSLSLDTRRDKDTLFYQGLLLKFPCLKNLSIRIMYNCRKIRICSQSVERISFVDVGLDYYREVTAEFDVPNIRKFHFEGSAFYYLSFETAGGNYWESDIHIMRYQGRASRLSSLRKLLQNLSMSKVSLSVHVVKYPSNYICDYTRCEPVPVVENLKIMDRVPNSGILDGLFLTCRPKFVNPNCSAPGGNNDLLKLLCAKLVDRTSENHCIPNPSVHGLEEVIVEVFERSLAEWRPLLLKTLLDASAYLENTQNFRFRLKWRR